MFCPLVAHSKPLDSTIAAQDSRAIFYFSFRCPAVTYPGNPPSIRADLGSAKITLGDLMASLVAIHECGDANPFLSDQ